MSCRKKPILKLITDVTIDHSGGDERQMLGTNQDPIPKCMTFVIKCCNVVRSFVSFVFKSMEPLSFDRPAELT